MRYLLLAGELLAHRLFAGVSLNNRNCLSKQSLLLCVCVCVAAQSKVKLDELNIPTTVFTPLEYGCVGFTQQGAEQVCTR